MATLAVGPRHQYSGKGVELAWRWRRGDGTGAPVWEQGPRWRGTSRNGPGQLLGASRTAQCSAYSTALAFPTRSTRGVVRRFRQE